MATETAKVCPHCGGEVRHWVEFTALLMDTVMLPVMQITTRTLRNALSTNRKSSAGFDLYMMLAKLSLGTNLSKPDEHTLLLHQMLWQEAETRGISMREFRLFGLPRSFFIATLPSGQRISFEGLPIPAHKDKGVWWLDTKSTLTQKFKKAGIPVARGGKAGTLKKAERIFAEIPHPVVVKPFVGSASRHTTMHVQTVDELKEAYRVAKQVAPFAMIEEELVGAVYRPTLVDGKLIATLRRDQPVVYGDGIHTVQELVATANKHPGRQGPYFSHITLDEAALAELAYQNLTPESVPHKGQRVQLHQKINWSVGGTTTDVTDDVHPDNVALFEKIAAILKAPVVGIDFIIDDISRSWREQEKCGVIECNSMPFFDNHHLPFEGTPRNVAKYIWDLVDQSVT